MLLTFIGYVPLRPGEIGGFWYFADGRDSGTRSILLSNRILCTIRGTQVCQTNIFTNPPLSLNEDTASGLLSFDDTGALASFFMTGDPNALKLTADDVSGVPDLSTGREWVIDSAGFTSVELVQLKERCAFWEEVAPDVPI